MKKGFSPNIGCPKNRLINYGSVEEVLFQKASKQDAHKITFVDTIYSSPSRALIPLEFCKNKRKTNTQSSNYIPDKEAMKDSRISQSY